MYEQVSMNSQRIANNATVAESAGPTISRVSELNSRINDIDSSLDALEDKMRIGLSHHIENASAKGAPTSVKPIPSVPLHGSLDDLSDRLTATFHRITELTTRVSL